VRKGSKHSPETILKMSAAHKGHVNKPLTAEQRAHSSEVHMGHFVSQETRAKLSKANKGVVRGPHTAEHIAKISAANRGKKRTPEQRAAISLRSKGRICGPCSEETKKKISEATKGKHFASAQTREKMRASHIGRKHKPCSEETKRKIGNATRGSIRPPEQREYLSNLYKGIPFAVRCGEEAAKSMAINNSIRMKLNNIRKYNKRISKPQRALFDFLKDIFPDAVMEYNVKLDKNYYLDIAVPDAMINFEYDDPYWHNTSKDIARDSILKNAGWSVMRINGTKELSEFIGVKVK